MLEAAGKTGKEGHEGLTHEEMNVADGGIIVVLSTHETAFVV